MNTPASYPDGRAITNDDRLAALRLGRKNASREKLERILAGLTSDRLAALDRAVVRVVWPALDDVQAKSGPL